MNTAREDSEYWDDDSDSIDEEPRQQNLWWRWLLVPIVPPIAAAAAFLLIGTWNWIDMKMRGGYHADGWFAMYIMPMFQHGAAAGAWSYSAGGVAPRGKVITAAVMATILCVLVALVLLLGFIAPNPAIDRFFLVISGIAILIGSIGGCGAIYENHEY